MRHPERFDPREGTGTLIDSEHRARYHWASHAVAGKEVLDAGCGLGYGIEILAEAGAIAVTGVDLDPGAVAESKARVGDRAEAIVEGDLLDLPLEDDSFDVVVCFETIEHLDGAEKALAEMRRVLRPDGVLIVSSPNPDVYLGGNEHHVHEFRPEELLEAVGSHFSEVASYRQDAWVGSTIEPADGDAKPPETLRTAATDGGEPTYGIVVASDGQLPDLSGLIAIGNPFDVRWWSEQLANSKGETAAAVEREVQAERRLQETATALLDANQELAQVPLLRHRLAELEQLHADLSAEYHALLGSKSWRVTAPLRRSRLRGGD
jgi:SAM-dependent methyltransferase